MLLEYAEKRKHLVDLLTGDGRIQTEPVRKAFLSVPREIFVPYHLMDRAYVDRPLDIGQGQTISAPHMVAIMVEALDLREGQTVLEIGAGSGYHAAIVSRVIGKTGRLISIERFPSLAEKAKQNLSKLGIEHVSVVTGDGSLGLSDHSPYDRIYVTCAAPSTPKTLLDQLNEQGKLLIPVGGMFAQLLLFEKQGKDIIRHDLGGCSFVPLVGKYGYDSL